MTIIEAIKTVLQDEPNGLTSNNIYEKIIEQKKIMGRRHR